MIRIRFSSASACVLAATLLAGAPVASAAEPVPLPGSCPPPSYPSEASRREQTGVVDIAFEIGGDGAVRETRVERSSFSARLDQAAIENVRLCRFAKVGENGKPTAGWSKRRFVWQLDELPDPLDRAPEHLRAYLVQARMADGLADPLQRCRSFPDYPGSQWRKADVDAACRARGDVPVTHAVIEQYLARGDGVGLDALFMKDLQRHFAPGDHSEIVHDDLHALPEGDGAERLLGQWLLQSPRSPFATAAQGHYMIDAAEWARSSADTQDAAGKEQRATQLLNSAVLALRRAIHLEPRLLQAHQDLIRAAVLMRDTATVDEASRLAQAVDPACVRVAAQRLDALAPAPGGSYTAISAYAASLAPLAALRPLLAPLLHYPDLHRASVLSDEGKYAAASALRQPAALAAPSELALTDLMWSKVGEDADPWERLALAMAAHRFGPGNAQTSRERGRHLLTLGQPQWAQPSLRMALASDPDSSDGQLILGMALLDGGEWEQSLPHLQKALSDPQRHQMASSRIIIAKRRLQKFQEADALTLAYVRKYADDAIGWLQRGIILEQLGKHAEADTAFARYRAFDGRQGWNLKAEIAELDAYLTRARGQKKP